MVDLILSLESFDEIFQFEGAERLTPAECVRYVAVASDVSWSGISFAFIDFERTNLLDKINKNFALFLNFALPFIIKLFMCQNMTARRA